MELGLTRMIELLVGLGAVGMRSGGQPGGLLRVGVHRTTPRPPCGSCGGALRSYGGKPVELAGLARVRAVCAADSADADSDAKRGARKPLLPSLRLLSALLHD